MLWLVSCVRISRPVVTIYTIWLRGNPSHAAHYVVQLIHIDFFVVFFF